MMLQGTPNVSESGPNEQSSPLGDSDQKALCEGKLSTSNGDDVSAKHILPDDNTSTTANLQPFEESPSIVQLLEDDLKQTAEVLSSSQKDTRGEDLEVDAEPTLLEEKEILTLTLTRDDLFEDEPSVLISENFKASPPKMDVQIVTNKESTFRLTQKREMGTPEKVDIKRAKKDDTFEDKINDSEELSQIKDQIRKMSFEYVKLTFVLKTDQLRTEIMEGSILETSSLFYWIKHLNDALYIREQSIGNTTRGLVHQLIASELSSIDSLIEDGSKDGEVIIKKLDEIKSLYNQEEPRVLKSSEGLLVEETDGKLVDELKKATSTTWQTSVCLKEILYLKEAIENEEMTFFTLEQQQLKKRPTRTLTANPNREIVNQHLFKTDNAWEANHYRSWHAKSFDSNRRHETTRSHQRHLRPSERSDKHSSLRSSYSHHEARSTRADEWNRSHRTRDSYREKERAVTANRDSCFCCGSSSHQTLVLCPKFFQLDLRERCSVVRKSSVQVCLICLQNHDSRSCLKPSTCTTKGCSEKVHLLLHKCSTYADSREEEQSTYLCICCKTGNHSLEACIKFLDFDKDTRYYYVRASPIRVCRGCLGYNHDVSQCPTKSSCVVNSHCSSIYHPLIHRCEINYSSSSLAVRAPSVTSLIGDSKDDPSILYLRQYFKMKLRSRLQDPTLCDDMMEAWTCQRLDEKELARMVEKFKPTSIRELQTAMLKKLESGPAWALPQRISLSDVASDTAEYFFRKSRSNF